jgi:hypothetical protein
MKKPIRNGWVLPCLNRVEWTLKLFLKRFPPFVGEPCWKGFKTKKAPHFFDALVTAIRRCIA